MGRTIARNENDAMSTLAALLQKKSMRNPVRRKALTSMFPVTLRRTGTPKAVTLSTTLDTMWAPDALAGPFAASILHESIPLAQAQPSRTRSKHTTLALIGTKSQEQPRFNMGSVNRGFVWQYPFTLQRFICAKAMFRFLL